MSTRNKDGKPALSIVVATTKPWPEMRGCLESLETQAAATGAEILVMDGDGQGLPEQQHTPAKIRWIRKPGASVFQLRATGMSEARADIVAVTEDHCRVAPDWCQRVLDAHQRHPEAAAIGGVVENGATGSTLDWAQFLVANGPFMRPIKNGVTDCIALQANVSYKRHALPGAFSNAGIMEMLYNQELHQRGELLLADDSLLVYHVQSLGFKGSCAINFHNGRSIAGYRLQIMRLPERWLRLLGCFILPPVMLFRSYIMLAGKKRPIGFALSVTPYLITLLVCHAAGEFVGYITGAGESPKHLR